MCRNIKPLFNVDPPATDAEIRDAAVQFVRKVAGMQTPSKDNQEAFDRATDEVANATGDLLKALTTSVAPKNREKEAEKAKIRAAKRFGKNL